MEIINQTRLALLEALQERVRKLTADMTLPTAPARGDMPPGGVRAPEIYKMRLSNSGHAKKLAPYIIIQYVSGREKQETGRWEDASAVIRLIFVVYDPDEQSGAVALMNVMDRVRIGLLREPVVGNAFKLDTQTGLEDLVYIDDTAPYYGGEMLCTFFCPPTKREVRYYGD